jgi:hypothetical protein
MMEDINNPGVARFINAARQLFYGRPEAELAGRPVVVAGGRPLHGAHLAGFHHGIEKNGGSLVYFEFRADRPEDGPTTAVIMAKIGDYLNTWFNCVPGMSETGMLYLRTQDRASRFSQGVGGLTIELTKHERDAGAEERARKALRSLASTVPEEMVEGVWELCDFRDEDRA